MTAAEYRDENLRRLRWQVQEIEDPRDRFISEATVRRVELSPFDSRREGGGEMDEAVILAKELNAAYWVLEPKVTQRKFWCRECIARTYHTIEGGCVTCREYKEAYCAES